MLQMESALILVLIFVAYVYFSSGKKQLPAHKAFSPVEALVHPVFNASIYTAGHLNTVPVMLNDILHRIFAGSVVLTIYLLFDKFPFYSSGNRTANTAGSPSKDFSHHCGAWRPIGSWKNMDRKKPAIGVATAIGFTVCTLQLFYPTWRISPWWFWMMKWSCQKPM